MIQKNIEGDVIEEYSQRGYEIQYDIEQQLALVAAAHRFNWAEPLHDIVRRLMNQVPEFNPEGDA